MEDLTADNSVDKIFTGGDFNARLCPNDHFLYAKFKVPSTDSEEEQF